MLFSGFEGIWRTLIVGLSAYAALVGVLRITGKRTLSKMNAFDLIVTVALGWLFVLSRYVHAYVHVTNNRLRYRRPAFIVGFVIVGLLWLWLAVWSALT